MKRNRRSSGKRWEGSTIHYLVDSVTRHQRMHLIDCEYLILPSCPSLTSRSPPTKLPTVQRVDAPEVLAFGVPAQPFRREA